MATTCSRLPLSSAPVREVVLTGAVRGEELMHYFVFAPDIPKRRSHQLECLAFGFMAAVSVEASRSVHPHSLGFPFQKFAFHDVNRFGMMQRESGIFPARVAQFLGKPNNCVASDGIAGVLKLGIVD